MQSRCCWPPERPSALSPQAVLHLVPQRRGVERALDALGELAPVAQRRRRAARRRRSRRSTSGTGSTSGTPSRRAAAARPRRGGPRRCSGRRAGSRRRARAGDEVVHPVERAQEGGLAAAGRADERRHLALGQREAHVLHGELVAVADSRPRVSIFAAAAAGRGSVAHRQWPAAALRRVRVRIAMATRFRAKVSASSTNTVA